MNPGAQVQMTRPKSYLTRHHLQRTTYITHYRIHYGIASGPLKAAAAEAFAAAFRMADEIAGWQTRLGHKRQAAAPCGREGRRPAAGTCDRMVVQPHVLKFCDPQLRTLRVSRPETSGRDGPTNRWCSPRPRNRR